MSYGQHLASGALSGFTSAICLQPFDLLKTRMQQGNGGVSRQSLRTRSVQGVVTTTRSVIAADGILGLWRGTLPTLARNVPGVALYMATLQHARAAMAESAYFARAPQTKSSSSVLPSLTVQGNLLVGAVTRTTVGTILNPFSVMKARYESNLFAYRNLWEAFISLARSGPAHLFRGAAASAMRDAPYAGLFLVAYEQLKRESAVLLQPVSPSSTVLINVFAGAGAGTAATIATHPFDVVKTKLQVRSEDRYHTFRSTVRAILTDRGPGGFFDGVSLRLSRKVLSSAIGWAVYEAVLLFMHNRSQLLTV